MTKNINTLKLLREELLSLNLSHKSKLDMLKHSTTHQRRAMQQNLDIFLYDHQIIPGGNWRYYIFQAGRGSGKTYVGGTWIAKKIRQGASVVALCAPTYKDVLRKQLPAILCWFDQSEIAKPFSKDDQTVKFKNGSLLYVLTSQDDQRGDNIEYLWCDEVCLWADGIAEKAEWRFDILDAAVRGGTHPQTLITSTPVSFPLFQKWDEELQKCNPMYASSGGSMYDNPTLPASYIKSQEEKHKNNIMYREQEIYGKLVVVNPNALYQPKWIDDARILHPDNAERSEIKDLQHFWSIVSKGEIQIKRIVVVVDPSGSAKITSDECGIVVLAQDFKNDVYVLHDKSGRHTPHDWALQARNLFYHYKKHFPHTIIVAETNFGGETVLENIRGADSNLKFERDIKPVVASKGKMLRAETSAAKYQRGKIHHIGYFKQLEREMYNYTGTKQEKSPNRMDALVHGINELLVVPQYAARDLRVLDNY